MPFWGMRNRVPLVNTDFSEERRFLQEPHGVTSQKTAFFIVIAMKPSNLTNVQKLCIMLYCKNALSPIWNLANILFSETKWISKDGAIGSILRHVKQRRHETEWKWCDLRRCCHVTQSFIVASRSDCESLSVLSGALVGWCQRGWGTFGYEEGQCLSALWAEWGPQ
jgi:hypothetical protein